LRASILFPSLPKNSHPDRSLGILLSGLAMMTTTIVILIVSYLIVESWPAIKNDGWWHFISDGHWFPLEQQFSILPMLCSSIAVTTGAILLAGPIGLLIAIFLQFYAPAHLARFYRHVLAILAGIPSVVYGLWGLTILVPLISYWQPPGASLLAALLILAIMILPTVAITSTASLAAVPSTLIQAAAALGMNRRATILKVVIPTARSGIYTGMIIATARALGETMAVVMVAGNVVQYPGSLFEPVRVLTANIALEMAYATGQHRASLYLTALLMTVMILVLAWLANQRNHESSNV